MIFLLLQFWNVTIQIMLIVRGVDIPILSIDLGPDTSVCENGIFVLDAGAGFLNYKWQDGAAEQIYTAFETGTYWVEATSICGEIISDTIQISLVDEILYHYPMILLFAMEGP
jgi:hypothetical protein